MFQYLFVSNDLNDILYAENSTAALTSISTEHAPYIIMRLL